MRASMRIFVFLQITAKRFSYFERSFSIIRNALFEFRQGLIVELNEREKRERRKKIRLRLNIRRKIPIFADRVDLESRGIERKSRWKV